MKSFSKILLSSAICTLALVVTSCEKEPQGPLQQEIESKLPGKWKLVSLDGKGPDRFETSSHEPTSSVAVDRTYSVELDAEGKINVLHEKYGEGSYKDYKFTYAEIKK